MFKFTRNIVSAFGKPTKHLLSMFNMCYQKKLERDFFYFRIFLVYMQNENAAVVTKCLRIQHVPSNLRNCASYSKLRDGCVSLCSEYIRNAKSALHNAYNA